MNMSMQHTKCCSESRMRSRTSQGVLEWSGGKDLYMGSLILVAGKVSHFIGIVPGVPKGVRGSTKGSTCPGGAHRLWGVHLGLYGPRAPAPRGSCAKETWGNARSTRNQANPWIKINKTSSNQQITKKIGAIFGGDFRFRGRTQQN